MHNIDCMGIDQFNELFLQINVFSCERWRFDGIADHAPLFSKFPGYKVLQPCQTVLLDGSAQPDRVIVIKMTIVIRCERNFVAYLFPHNGDSLNHYVKALVSDLNLCKRMFS